MNSPSRWPSPVRVANRCAHWERWWPARRSPICRLLRRGRELPAPAKHSATAVLSDRGINVSRPARRAAGIPAVCAVPAETTFAALRVIAAAAALARIDSTIPTTAAPAEIFAGLGLTNTPTAWMASVTTPASKARCAATGRALSSVPIPKTAARAGMSARHRPRSATGGFAARLRAKAIARNCGAAGMAVAGNAPAPTDGTATATGVTPIAHRTTRTIRTADVLTFLMKGNCHVSSLG
jgi:hypothetical protein